MLGLVEWDGIVDATGCCGACVVCVWGGVCACVSVGDGECVCVCVMVSV